MASKNVQTAGVPNRTGNTATLSNNPRRPPAHRSVSLLHAQKRRAAPPAVNSDSSSPDSSDPSRLKTGRGSSGESSNADKWFDQSNNQVRDHSASFADGDPPFFMRNSSSSETPPDAQVNNTAFPNEQGVASSLPLHTDLLRLGTETSSTEEYRGVIDDLTIENKKLKRRLKKYEKMHDSHLKDEKLFEVRIHGLPTDKKRELEETLRKFAEGLANNAFPTNGYNGLMPMLPKDKTASSQTSLPQTDSAYASLSASGQGSSSLGNESRSMKPHRIGHAVKRDNIHSYLHHIPEGLLPQSSPANMSERTKKKIVVRRLEQIFAGKGAALGGHQHPQQQQEVSNSAARADKADTEAQGRAAARVEGHREALIMAEEVEDPADSAANKISNDASPNSQGENKEVASTAPREDQRPTRPLDLDPHRAQVPVENIRYMRHLGFSPYDPMSSKSPEEGHGWVYLNLLINMAQLHTINVTSDFVRKAVTEYSSRFEISADGRKVRWKGGRSVTRTSSSGGASTNSPFRTDTTDEQSPRKRPKLTHRDTFRSEASKGAATSTRGPENKMVYTPLFFHRSNSDEAYGSSSEEEDTMSSYAQVPMGGESSALTSSGMRTISNKKKQKREDGPIIFYNNARFCTDLSGDRKVDHNANAPPYVPATSIPVGTARPPGGAMMEKRGPLAEARELPEAMDLDDNPIPQNMELFFPPSSPVTETGRKNWVKEPLELEVTGIGGVWPADNFSIDVESRHARVQDPTPAVAPSKHLPPKLAGVLRTSSNAASKRAPEVSRQITRTAHRSLAPSDLPPALSFMPYNSSSYEDDMSEYSSDEEDQSPNPMLDRNSAPSAAPQPVGIHYDSTSEEGDVESEDMSDDESDGSLDLLAAARAMDPQAVRDREREYDANMAERLAEEIPAGSSAATAGGGSGFNSPVQAEVLRGLNEEFRRSVREGRGGAGVRGALKRAATADSMTAMKGEEDADADGDEEMVDSSG